MGKEVDKKFTWVIKNFCSEQSSKIYSDEFIVDACKWRLLAFPKGNNCVQHLSLYLVVAGSEYFPAGWRRHAKFFLSVVNQNDEKLSQTKETHHWYDAGACEFGYTSMLPLSELHAKDSGFLKNGQVKLVAEVDVLQVIGKLDVTEESQETTKPLGEMEKTDAADSSDLIKEASSVKESMNVNGFQVLPSQVESASRIFKRHPDIASEFRPKNPHMRSAYMNVLLSLIDMMCQSTKELCKDDLAGAYASLAYLTDAGMNLNWLEGKLEEVSQKKENEEAGETRVQEIEEELKELKLRCSNLEAQLEKAKADLSVFRTPLSFVDVVESMASDLSS